MRYEDVRWQDAACKGTDTEAFYPVNGLPPKTAVRICQSCPILNECGSYAIENETYGYWAGMAEVTRLEIRMGRRKRAA